MSKNNKILRAWHITQKQDKIVKKFGKVNRGEASYVRRLIDVGSELCEFCGGTGYIMDPHSDDDQKCVCSINSEDSL